MPARLPAGVRCPLPAFELGGIRRGATHSLCDAGGAAFGNGGQRLFLVPRLNLAVVMTAGAYNDAGIAIKEMELFRQIIAAVQR